MFELDHAINQCGLGIDQNLVSLLTGLVCEAQLHLTDGIRRLTNGQVRSLNQVVQLREWLKFQGVDTPDLRRNTVRALLAGDSLSAPARTALQARLDASRSSTAKLAAITAARSQDGRVRGTFQYYGAARTGRWAGRRLQPQNLFRGSIKDVGAALRAIRAGASPRTWTCCSRTARSAWSHRACAPPSPRRWAAGWCSRTSRRSRPGCWRGSPVSTTRWRCSTGARISTPQPRKLSVQPRDSWARCWYWRAASAWDRNGSGKPPWVTISPSGRPRPKPRWRRGAA